MGKQLLAFYAEADRLGGLAGKMALARLTRLSSSQAVAEPDTDVLVDRFRVAMRDVLKDFSKRSNDASTPVPASADNPAANAARVSRHEKAITDVLSRRTLFTTNREKAYRFVTVSAAEALDVARASIWFCDEAFTLIRCVDLFERKEDKHSTGTELFARDFAPYFEALKKERTIAAHDAHTDPRTSCFSAPYLSPLGINSMLDVPIWANGRMAGVLCNEHVGPKRTWLREDEDLAYMLANMVSTALEKGP